MRSLAAAFVVITLLTVQNECCGAPQPAATEQVNLDPTKFDEYGGSTLLRCGGGATGRFYTEKIGSRWWICTPAGNVFWAMGVYGVIPDNSTDLFGVNHYTLVGQKYAQGPTKSPHLNWSVYMARRLKSWGFNTLDSYAYAWIIPWKDQGSAFPKDPGSDKSTIPEKLAAVSASSPTNYASFNAQNYTDQPVKDLLTGVRKSVYTGWRSLIADYFDDRFWTYMESDFSSQVIDVSTPWRLGVVVDDTDYLWWAGPGTDFATVPAGHNSSHAGWVSLTTAPVRSAGNYHNTNFVYKDTTVYTKAKLAAFLTEKYGSISALNEAWGSSYTSFGSTGTTISGEVAAVGDELATTFNYQLSQPQPSPFSVQVLVDGNPVAGDNGEGRFLTVGGKTTGTVDYGSGQISIVLDTPPASGSSITVNYVSCGFGCGSGLLDEDGTHAWVPRMDATNHATGGGEHVQEDLDSFLYEYAKWYFSNVKARVNQYFPGYLYLGPTTVAGWSTPARKEVLRAAGEYVDVLRISQMDFSKTGADWLDRLNFVAQWAGDKPWTFWVGATANSDSYFAHDPRGCAAGTFPSQRDRGEWYQRMLRGLLTPTADGTRHIVGIDFWQLVDNRKECANWGLMTRRDNPYDGVSAVKAAGTDEWGYPTGGEGADYGDFLSAAKSVNWIWVPSWNPNSKRLTGTKVQGAHVR